MNKPKSVFVEYCCFYCSEKIKSKIILSSVHLTTHLHSLEYTYLKDEARIVPMLAMYMNIRGIPTRAYIIVTTLPREVQGVRLP